MGHPDIPSTLKEEGGGEALGKPRLYNKFWTSLNYIVIVYPLKTYYLAWRCGPSDKVTCHQT